MGERIKNIYKLQFEADKQIFKDKKDKKDKKFLKKQLSSFREYIEELEIQKEYVEKTCDIIEENLDWIKNISTG